MLKIARYSHKLLLVLVLGIPSPALSQMYLLDQVESPRNRLYEQQQESWGRPPGVSDNSFRDRNGFLHHGEQRCFGPSCVTTYRD